MTKPLLDTVGLTLYDRLLKDVAGGSIALNNNKLILKSVNGDVLTSIDLEEKAAKKAGVFYIEGTGDTDGTWLGTHEDITEYYPGLMIAYKPGIAGASGGTTLNINGLGAVSVVRNTTSAVTTHYGVTSIIFLVYTVDSSGTAYWKVSDYDSDTKTRSSNLASTKIYIIGAKSQSTSGQTTYSNSKCYIGTDNCLYSNGTKVSTTDTTYGAATSSTLGLVKVGSNITNSSGEISLSKDNVTTALGYTPLQTAPVTSVNGSTGAVTGLATTASPTFTGTPKAPTASAGTSSTQLATTAFVANAVSGKIGVSGSRGSLAGYETNGTSTTINDTANDSNQTGSSITVSNGTSGTSWTKIVRVTAAVSVTLGSSWTWSGGSAPTIAAGGVLVCCWCGSGGIASFVSPS